jgi:hypothetical protein
MKRTHRPRRPRTVLREGHLSAVGRLESGLQLPDEAAWYAERHERLGRALFGDLWDSEETESPKQNNGLEAK